MESVNTVNERLISAFRATASGAGMVRKPCESFKGKKLWYDWTCFNSKASVERV